MCQQNDKLIFCTCEEQEDKQNLEKLPETYSWTLTQFLGLKANSLRGKIVGPQQNLGNGITLESVLEQLNHSNCFDFDYKPTDDDCLRISLESKRSNYFKMIYKNGQWIAGRNPAFRSILKEVANGIVYRRKFKISCSVKD